MTRQPGEPLTHPVASLVTQANAQITTVPLAEAASLLTDPGVLFVDIRDPREWAAHGIIPGAFRAPRGMLEFWVDPDSPYYKPALDDGRRIILYCGSGWRSALATATLQHMGVAPVAHLAGGFIAWQQAGLPTAPYPPQAAD